MQYLTRRFLSRSVITEETPTSIFQSFEIKCNYGGHKLRHKFQAMSERLYVCILYEVRASYWKKSSLTYIALMEYV
jgi:hypothetical protein